jgi:CTP:molybdopterin cytidylyltransferase MocA
MMPSPEAIGCAVLAGGASRRLGRPKQLVSMAGEPLVRRMAKVALGSRCAAVSVILGAGAPEVAAALDDLPVTCLLNDQWAEGMSSSVRAASAWGREMNLGAMLLILVDQIHLTARHLDALITASAGGRRLVASRYDGIVGVPALFPRQLFPAMAGLHGDVGARALLRIPGLPVATVWWEEGRIDLDVPRDLPAG